jgi:hypothetical protein
MSTCPVCWYSHGCDLPRGHAHTDHLCLIPTDHLPDQDGGSEIIMYDVCNRSPVGDPRNFMADYSDRKTLFGPEVISS